MKFKPLMFIVAFFFVAQIAGTILFLTANKSISQDTVEINDILQQCTVNFDSLENINNVFNYDFSVIDNNEKLLYTTKKDLSQNINQAIKNRDTILDIKVANMVVGKLIIASNYSNMIKIQNTQLIIFTTIMLTILAAVLIIYVVYINRRVIKPFNSLNKFATAISKGDFNTESLYMDKQNIFGAFTESFDIMRTELKSAKNAEQKAQTSKKLLIANLSHDIKTPVASIKAIAEVGEIKAAQKDKASFAMINKKADQVNELVTNLFSATLEEMNQLTINIGDYDSKLLKDMILSSDYLNKTQMDEIPEMLLKLDNQRFQQVLDNIISNSYKYANTSIEVSFKNNGNFLQIIIKDFGGFSENSENLLVKFYRGQNALGKEGTGLGLYISKYLMKAMGGDLMIDSNTNYFSVIISIKIS